MVATPPAAPHRPIRANQLFVSKVPHTDTEVLCDEDIPSVLLSLISEWCIEGLSVETVAGGITNRIYKASCATAQPSPLLVRVFGGAELFTKEQRNIENTVVEQLGEAGIAPNLYGVFGNGRLEGWVEGRNVALGEMVEPHVIKGVASGMARLHKFEPRGCDISREVGLWGSMESWVREAGRLKMEGKLVMPEGILLEDCLHGLAEVREELEGGQWNIVFSHNDLLCGNIMVSRDERVTLIDFEYSSFNYRGFDIGNFFCETMGGTVDGFIQEWRYPSEEIRWEFCEEYLKNGEDDVTEDKVSALVLETERFGRVSHLYWGLWAVVQSVSSNIDFPYLTFAQQRLKLFFKVS